MYKKHSRSDFADNFREIVLRLQENDDLSTESLLRETGFANTATLRKYSREVFGCKCSDLAGFKRASSRGGTTIYKRYRRYCRENRDHRKKSVQQIARALGVSTSGLYWAIKHKDFGS